MRGLTKGFSSFGFVLLWCAMAQADPAPFQPDGCEFQVAFPAAPIVTQTSATTSRGDKVITNKASLRSDADGKTSYFRAECSHIPNMGFVDEAVLQDVLSGLAKDYKLQSPRIWVDHDKQGNAVGHIQAKTQLGGKEITVLISRYSSKDNIFDIWSGAENDAFPSDADTAFLQTLQQDGQPK